MQSIIKLLSEEFKTAPQYVENIMELVEEGNTIPFIARYRKEKTGSMDDQQLRALCDRLQYLQNLQRKKQEVKELISAQDKLTPELAADIDSAVTLAEVDDLYAPYRPKRRTRAMIARERGLEPLAMIMLLQKNGCILADEAQAFVSEENDVPDTEHALNGAMDIIAEQLSEDAALIKRLREQIRAEGSLCSVAAKKEDSVYRNYYDYSEPLKKLQGHRVLAMLRGEREEFLSLSLTYDKAHAQSIITSSLIKNHNCDSAQYLEAAAQDSLDRLIAPKIERQLRTELYDNAATGAIGTFSVNLKALLMQAPLKGRAVMGFDPAYRTGCKIAVVDVTGRVLDTAIVYPTPPHNKTAEAQKTLNALIKKHDVSVVAIGNGTASRESESFVADMLKGQDVGYVIVNEAGASVYSASELAAKEFPDFDVSLRSAVSIARRLQDPLAELVKIDPKSIGVGQYQHDMPQKQLKEALGGVVEDCVNSVGVDLNTASPSLLSYVAGINGTVAKNIVTYREQNGAFGARRQLLKVPKLGARAYEQCAGFLRVRDGKNPLDNTGVHPESYGGVEKLLKLTGFSLTQQDAIVSIAQTVKASGVHSIAEQLGMGVPTLTDILSELQKPGRDPRDELPPPLLRSDVLTMGDLKEGMKLTGTVRNVVDFGAFVDIGVHHDGLVHISRMANRFIKHPSEVVKTGDIVTVWVTEVVADKHRISLTMKEPQ